MVKRRQIRGEDCYRRPWNWIEMRRRKRRRMKAGATVRMEEDKIVGEPKGKLQMRRARGEQHIYHLRWLKLLCLSSEEDSDDEEDETAQLLRELEKIKRERAEEQAKKEREQSEQNAASNEARIASANPLLNLAAALGQAPAGLNTTAPGSFSVKKRWDDGESSAAHVKLRMFI